MTRFGVSATSVVLLALAALAGCTERSGDIVVPGDPAAPRALDGWYFDRSVHLAWELAPGWHGETFRVYGKRRSDSRYFRLAEVTSCSGGVCTYVDWNVVAGVAYRYFVVAVEPDTGVESGESGVVEVFVPEPTPPPPPTGLDAVGLDATVYLRWEPDAREATGDFSHYRIYLEDPDGGDDFFLGETDSEGFLDERARNGERYTYRVSSVDDQGHESAPGPSVSVAPRPDYHGEWLRAYQDVPEESGFRFRADEGTNPVVDGDDPARDFRFEVDGEGWWLVPGPEARLHRDAFATTALKCGPGSDADCVDLRVAPASGYGTAALEVLPRTTYVFRVSDVDGGVRYGAVRVEQAGTDQSGDALLIFDWAFQLRSGERQLVPPSGEGSAGGA